MENKISNISVIIPTCDRQQYLEFAIESVIGQTLLPCEIIVVDNGYNCANVPSISQLPLSVIRLPARCGVSRARNAGAHAAKGRYLAFLDDDDWWEPNFLELLYAKLVKTRADCVYGRKDIYAKKVVSPYKIIKKHELNPKSLVINNPGVGGINFLICKDVYFAVGGFDPNLAASEDRALAIELCLRKYNVEIEPNAAAVVRSHQGERLRGKASRKIKFVMKYWKYYSLFSLIKTCAKLLYMAIKR
jgi:glycosyltransferase involved in cell wall biosynthesis